MSMEKETNTTEVENQKKINESEPTEVEDDSTDEELEFDEETEQIETTQDKSSKKEQTAEEKRLAFQKRQEEKEKKRLLEEQRRLEREHYEKGIIKGAGGVNKFTGEKLLTKHDIEDYTLMLEMEEKGLNPDDGFAVLKYKRDKQIEEENKQLATQSEQIKIQEFMDNDIKTFTKERANIDVKELLNDENFKAFSEKLLGKVPLIDIYDTFEKINFQTEDKANQIARSKLAKKLSSPKGLGTGGEAQTKSFKDMTDSEFEKMVELAKQGKLSQRY